MLPSVREHTGVLLRCYVSVKVKCGGAGAVDAWDEVFPARL
jgi:hypothetical protein